MEERRYMIIRKMQEKNAKITGIISSAVFLCVALCSLYFSGLKYLDPPPPEKQDIMIDFEEMEIEEEKPVQKLNSTRPRSEEVSKEIKLVQQSQAQQVGSKVNER